jgi:alanyl-tRNA synthetase
MQSVEQSLTLSGAQIRDKFVSYFKDKRGHLHLPSSSLIPDNPTLLLTSAGMVQFVPIFLGQAPSPNPPRAVTVQKCARAGGKDSDIENVGRTARHHSFFEMLGNFSFGDYFKKEVIPWAWEFVTKEIGLEPEKLFVTVFKGSDQVAADDEAYDIWHKSVGVPTERIFRIPGKDNFWGPPGPTGPCGPCSEIFYDRGAIYGCSDDPTKCGIGICECDRYLEIWNLVFMELFKDEHGVFTPLANKNVDTGGGLERMALVLQKKNNTYETDLFFPILQKISELAGVAYTGGVPKPDDAKNPLAIKDTYLKIISDHARCVTFLIADGVRMSNVGRGYVLRFITRRAARFGRLLGLTEPFIYKLVPVIVSQFGSHYRELVGNESLVAQIIREEEERFAKTIDRGIDLLNELLDKNDAIIDGGAVFNLYATYGFPVELTKEIALEQGKDIDMEGFNAARKEHEEISAGNKFNVIMTGDSAFGKVLKDHGATKFTGYKNLKGEAHVVALIKDGKLVEHVEEGDEVDVLLDQTPFYGESGGQVGDIGLISNKDSSLHVLDTKKHEGLHVHRVRSIAGSLEPGQVVTASVDKDTRTATMLHHSTAHLFHAAIRDFLGKHVAQAGSQITPQNMRFDFSFERQPTPAELQEIESTMNEWVRQNLPVITTEMGIEEAKQSGAIAMFGEKYGDVVRVLKMGDVSLEFCGGTHVSSLGEIGPIKITSEGSIASGVRRVEALSGARAWHHIAESMQLLQNASGLLKVKPLELVSQIERLQDQVKQKERLLQARDEELALLKVSDLKAERIGKIQYIGQELPGMNADGLKSAAESLKAKAPDMVVVLVSSNGVDKVAITAAVSDALVKEGFNAGLLVKEFATITGGGGGGKPQLAQAGGKDPAKIAAAFEKIKAILVEKAG